jgi:DNA-binding NarL/FixJ family response regulator
MLQVGLFTDEPVLATGLASVISSAPGFRVAAVYRTTAELTGAVPGVKHDVTLIDLTPDVTFSVLTQVSRAMPGCPIVLWVRDISPELAHQAIQLGVRGILRKALSPGLLVKCLTNVCAGELWLDKGLTANMLTARMIPLTRREGQLVMLLSQGLKNKEIGAALSISEGTVKVYLSRLFQKVGAKDRFELALYGLRNFRNMGSVPAAADIPAQPLMMSSVKSLAYARI